MNVNGQKSRCIAWERSPIQARLEEDGRPFSEAVLWIALTGSPKRDPPAQFALRGTTVGDSCLSRTWDLDAAFMLRAV
jgi:hypothetical protein